SDQLSQDRSPAARAMDGLLTNEKALRAAHERKRDVVDAQLGRELEVFEVLLGQGRQWQRTARHTDPLPLAKEPPTNHGAFGPPFGLAADGQFDASVVDEHTIPWLQSIDELGM